MAQNVMSDLMEQITPVFGYRFTMRKKYDDQMVSAYIHLIEKVDWIIIRQVTGEEGTLTQNSLGHIHREQSQSGEEYVMRLRVN